MPWYAEESYLKPKDFQSIPSCAMSGYRFHWTAIAFQESFTHTHTHSHARCLAGRRQSQTITNLDLDKSILRHLPSEKEALLLFRKVCSDLSSSVIFQRQAPALGLKVAMLEGVLQTFLRHWSTSLGFLRRRDDAFLEYLMQAKRYISEWALSAA